jgi:Carboxypeptidase regulatory-like domain
VTHRAARLEPAGQATTVKPASRWFPVMRAAPVLVLAAMALALLAGCAGKETPAAATTGPVATTGSVRGVVVDAAVRPLGGVVVTLRANDRSTLVNTTTSGLFRFDNVPAGSQVIKAHLKGYLDVQVPVQVEAGVVEPLETKVTLTGDPSYVKPYIAPFKFKGIMQCSAVVNAPQPAGRAAIAACDLPSQTTGVPLTQETFTIVHTLDAGRPRFVQSELVWQANGPFANQLLLYMDQKNHTATASVGAGGASTGYIELEHAAGPSPVVVHVAGADVNRLGMGYDLQLRVFAWYQDPVPAGAVFQQDFVVYSNVFYGFSPPAGWTFSKDSTLPPVPPG